MSQKLSSIKQIYLFSLRYIDILHELYVASRREGRLHSRKIQINLVFPLICTTF